MKITVVGAGYVGLSLSVLLSQYHEVIIHDILQNKIDLINNKISPIKDTEIEQFLLEKKLNIKATISPNEAYNTADYIIIAVPTNYKEDKNFFDTQIVEGVLKNILSINKNSIIIVKSTIPVGFTNKMRIKYNTTNIFFSPEFLRESKALYDNLYPSRIIIGTDTNDEKQIEIAKNFANLLKDCSYKKDSEIQIIGMCEAEAIKLFCNTYLALRINFFNELDTYAEINQLNTKDIISGICSDPRIGNFYNNPSFGYGGYCLPKDTKQLLANYENIPEDLIKAVVKSNRTRKDFISNQILKIANKYKNNSNDNIIIGVFKLTMKTGSDNFRYSSIKGIIKRLQEKEVKIIVYEPLLKNDNYENYTIINDLSQFKQMSNVIIANRYDKILDDVKYKVYTRDIYGRD